MPFGVSWPRYFAAVTCALGSMFAGSQTVHMMYKPLRDFDAKVELEKQKLRMATGTSIGTGSQEANAS